MPAWDWPTILILQGAFAAACAALTGIVGRSLGGAFFGLIFGPVIQIVLIGVGAGFFYFLFSLYFKREIPYRQIYLTMIFAAIPALLLNIVSPVLPLATLIGLAAAAGLLYVGFVDNFYLDRVKIRNILVALLVLCAISWGASVFKTSRGREALQEKATPESMDILERDFNKDKN